MDSDHGPEVKVWRLALTIRLLNVPPGGFTHCHPGTMNKVLAIFLLTGYLTLVLARYEAIPVEDVIDLSELTRLRTPREVEAVGGVRGARGAAEESLNEHEGYVDFGAHTGSRGSYGWYVDFPAHH